MALGDTTTRTHARAHLRKNKQAEAKKAGGGGKGGRGGERKEPCHHDAGGQRSLYTTMETANKHKTPSPVDIAATKNSPPPRWGRGEQKKRMYFTHTDERTRQRRKAGTEGSWGGEWGGGGAGDASSRGGASETWCASERQRRSGKDRKGRGGRGLRHVTPPWCIRR